MSPEIEKVLNGESDGCIVCGDCLEVMADMPDGCVDAVVTDPPYNLDFPYEAYNDLRGDYADWCFHWLGECERVSLGAVAFTPGHPNLRMWLSHAPPLWVACWWKPASMNHCPLGASNWEPICVYGKRVGGGGCDVIRAPVVSIKDGTSHPCPKPEEWGAGLIRLVTSGNIILDPFCGSGTTCVAAKKLGRKYIGIEIDEKYCRIARNRVANTEKPLFT